MTKTVSNNPALAGQLAARKITFGNNSRYAFAPVHTRFDAVQYFVWDANKPDEYGAPTIIRQFIHKTNVTAFIAKAKSEELSIMEAEEQHAA